MSLPDAADLFFRAASETQKIILRFKDEDKTIL